MTTERRDLPSRRNHRTQKVRIAGQRTAYDVLGRLASLALQYGAPLEKVGEMLMGAKFEPAGPVQLHARIKNCTSLPDLIGRHLLAEFCGRADLAHVDQPEPGTEV